MYWTSLIGQKLALEQMNELYDASMGALNGESTQTHDRNTTAGEPV